MRAVAFLLLLLLAGCDGGSKAPPVQEPSNASDAAMPEEDRILILETRISELETRLASEKVTREQIDRQLANSIAEVEQAGLTQPSEPVAEPESR